MIQRSISPTHRRSKGSSFRFRVSGRVLRDPEKARQLWNVAASVWFPRGPEDPNLAVLEIDVERAGILGLARRDGSASARLRESQAHGRHERAWRASNRRGGRHATVSAATTPGCYF